MKKIIAVLAVLALAGSASAATLSYSYGSTWGGYNARELIISADEGGNPVWDMSIRVPTAGNTMTGHSAYMCGQIYSFKDAQYGGGYEYSAEAGANIFSQGLMQFAGMSSSTFYNGASYSETQNGSYYEFSLTGGQIHLGSATDPTNIVDATLTVRINAPTVGSPTGYTTNISARLTLVNNQATDLDMWFAGSSVGAADMDIAGSGATFVNPTSTPASDKPNVHTGESPLFLASDWYGTRIEGSTGLLMRAEVLAGNEATMRPGLKFELGDDGGWFDFYYSDLANNNYGSTTQDSGGYHEFNVGQPGAAGSGVRIDPGQTLTFDYYGLIEAPVPEPATMGLLGLGLLGLVIRRKK